MSELNERDIEHIEYRRQQQRSKPRPLRKVKTGQKLYVVYQDWEGPKGGRNGSSIIAYMTDKEAAEKMKTRLNDITVYEEDICTMVERPEKPWHKADYGETWRITQGRKTFDAKVDLAPDGLQFSYWLPLTHRTITKAEKIGESEYLKSMILAEREKNDDY